MDCISHAKSSQISVSKIKKTQLSFQDNIIKYQYVYFFSIWYTDHSNTHYLQYRVV